MMTETNVTAKQTDEGFAFTFPDNTYIEVLQPERDRHRRMPAEVIAKTGDGRLINKARIDLLDLRDRERFHQVAASLDGTINWQARLIFVLEHVDAVMAQAAENMQASAATSVPTQQYPELAEEALYGLPGHIVCTVDPYTEADPVATLLNTLVGVGNMIGANPHARVQHDLHPARLFVVQVGESSKGRKGTGWSTPRYVLSKVDEVWATSRIKGGLSSGEGLIYNVRDPLSKRDPIKERGRVVEYQDIEIDPGVNDKRLLIVEPEFASVLTVMAREKNTLSEIIRQAWDSGNLSPLTRNNPMTATGAHISIISHITKHELLARLDDTSKANGFGNRFLWALVKRSKLLPEGKAAPDHILNPFIRDTHAVLEFANTVTEVKRDSHAEALWAEIYGPLSEGKPGLLGAMVSRAEAQVLRLSVIYALMDQSAFIRQEHLKAALAVWEYCEQSAIYIFGERLGDATADRMLEALRNAGPKGMTDNDMYELFGRNKSANERARALNMLASLGLVTSEREETGGRPKHLWRVT